MIFIGDKKGKIYYTNSAVSRKLGYTKKELLGFHILDIHPKSIRQEAEQIFSEMFSGQKDSCPLPLEKKNGHLLPVETKVWFGLWNNKDCIFGLSKDLSREQELLQKFNKIFDCNPALMAISSFPERKFTDVNLAFLKTLGYSKDEVIGKKVQDLSLFPQYEKQDVIASELEKNGFIQNVE